MHEDQFWQMQVGGQVIRTKGSHPFQVHGRGWVEVCDLRPGDPLMTDNGQTTPVEDVVAPPGWPEGN
jgi:hypothetical protein